MQISVLLLGLMIEKLWWSVSAVNKPGSLFAMLQEVCVLLKDN